MFGPEKKLKIYYFYKLETEERQMNKLIQNHKKSWNLS